jgi:hypothetical protein
VLRLDHHAQYQLHQTQKPFGIAVQKAIIAHAAKPFGKDMLQHQPQKIFPL